MIVVTGCRRSGTSLWMQMLAAAELPIVGEPFAGELEALEQANPNGFYESEHRYGAECEPEALRGQVVKMFVPGVVETDEDELERVIFSIRPWREHVASTRAFEKLEAKALQTEVPKAMPADLEWWFENYCLFGDFADRDYPMMIVAYDRVLDEPKVTAERALTYLDQDLARAGAMAAVVDPTLRRADPSAVTSELPAEIIATFDALYERIRDRDPFDDAFVDRLGATHEALMPRIEPYLASDEEEIEVENLVE